MKRIATAAVGVPLALAAVFWLPGPWFFLVILALIEVAVVEYARLVGRSAPRAPVRVLLLLVPLGAVLLSSGLWPGGETFRVIDIPWLGAFATSIGIGALVLAFRVPPDQGLISLGALAFGLPYFALPIASLYRLQQLDAWVLLLLLAVVWLGDAAAYYWGSRWGRRRLAPRVSPNKTWEGAFACIGASLVAGAVWSYARLGEVRLAVLVLALVVSVAAQIGDLVESLIKRGAGVKDSGSLFPGHGGVMDRMDALMFAAPVMLLGTLLFDVRGSMP